MLNDSWSGLEIARRLLLHPKTTDFSDPIAAEHFRSNDVGVGQHNALRFETVQEDVDKFVRDVNHHLNRTDAPELAARAHFDLAYIHPYMDGNGRVCTLVANWILAKGRFRMFSLPEKACDEYNAGHDLAVRGRREGHATAVLFAVGHLRTDTCGQFWEKGADMRCLLYPHISRWEWQRGKTGRKLGLDPRFLPMFVPTEEARDEYNATTPALTWPSVEKKKGKRLALIWTLI
ncbi:hypothetical protein niasHT_014503 [Heterodera trifolii]|uniref:Fido domain-containing protein n=1 Tax=Heterodera trifolii TaxID=157864 RepID=A0ABD2L1F2_9BILA